MLRPPALVARRHPAVCHPCVALLFAVAATPLRAAAAVADGADLERRGALLSLALLPLALAALAIALRRLRAAQRALRLCKDGQAALQRELAERSAALDACNGELGFLSQHDELTRLATRRRFEDVLENEYLRLRRSGAPLSVLRVDVDSVKHFNDRYGRAAGDECLHRIGLLIGTLVCRAPDLAARYGGEEFAIILPETDSAGAVALAERIRLGVAALAMAHSASRVAETVTVSAGVATVSAGALAVADEAMVMAAEQLALAKSAGCNCVKWRAAV